jgi:hypothetical protein
MITGGPEISYQYQNGDTFLVQAFAGSELIAFKAVTVENRSLKGQIFTDRVPYVRDRDTNDPLSTPTSNNSALEAQALTLEQRVMGHLRLASSVMGTPKSGALSGTGDDQDWYQIDVNSAPFYLHLSTLSPADQVRMSVYDDSDPAASALWTNTNTSGSALTVDLSGLAGNKRYWVAVSLEAGEFENYLLAVPKQVQHLASNHKTLM